MRTNQERIKHAACQHSERSFRRQRAQSSRGRIIFKCAFKAVTQGDYTATLTTTQIDVLKAAVCDWSQKGIGQQPRVGIWLTYPR